MGLRTIIIVMLVLLASCEKERRAQEKFKPPVGDRLYITTSDIVSAGELKIINLSKHELLAQAVPIHADALVRIPAHGDHVFVVNRFPMDNIQAINRQTFETDFQFSVGRRSNAADIVVVENMAYVSRFGAKTLIKVRLSDGKKVKEWDLSAFADSDGFPEPSRMLLWKDKILIQLKRLNKHKFFLPNGKAALAIIELKNDSLRSESVPMRLANPSPFAGFKLSREGRIFLPLSGHLGKLDGGIEEVDPDGLRSLGIVVSESTLGGDILDCAFPEIGKAVCIIYTAAAHTRLVEVNLQERKVQKVLSDPGGYVFSAVLSDFKRGRVYVADRSPNRSGIRVFELPDLKERLDLFVDVGLPPNQMEIGN